MNNELTRLRRFMIEFFSLEELRTLCFDLGIDFDELSGEGRSAKVRELLLWSGRHRRLAHLLDASSRLRRDPFDQAGLSTDTVFLEKLSLQLLSLASSEERTGLQSVPPQLNGPATAAKDAKDKKRLLGLRTGVWVALIASVAILIAAISALAPELRPESSPDPTALGASSVETGQAATLSGTPDSPPAEASSGTLAASSLPTAASLPVELPDGSTVILLGIGGVKHQYTILSAQLQPLSSGSRLLHLRVRAWTDAGQGMGFWTDSFRLVTGDIRLAPVNFLNELVDRDETVDGDVEFEIGDSLTEAVLVIEYYGERSELRLIFP
jgi:hypothetical protein